MIRDRYRDDMMRGVSVKDVIDMRISCVDKYTDLKPEQVPDPEEIFRE